MPVSNVEGKLEAKERFAAKAPPFNPYAILNLDGRKVVAFKGIVERVMGTPLGRVRYSTAATPDGKGESLTFIESMENAQTAVGQAPTPGTATTTSGGWADRSSRIEFQSMLHTVADRLLADPSYSAGVSKEKFADELFAETWYLYNRFQEEAKKLNSANPTK